MWDRRAVVYDCASGDTLFLDELPSTVFELVRAAPLDETTLLRQLVERFEDEPELLRAAARQALAELDKLGLVSQHTASLA